MKRCFIFSAGSDYGLRERPTEDDLVIAADAGYRTCRREGIVPDLLLGDFDSMPEPTDFSAVCRVPVEKDDTDTMLAVKEGLRRGCREFHLYGGTGGKRLDHTLANLQTLLYLCDREARGILYDRDFAYTAIRNGTLHLRREVDWGIVSVFCFGEAAQGVTLKGLQYPLENAELTAAFPLGVSNHFSAEEAEITVACGTLVVGWQLGRNGERDS